MTHTIVYNPARRMASVLERSGQIIYRTRRVGEIFAAGVHQAEQGEKICSLKDWPATREFMLQSGNILIERD